MYIIEGNIGAGKSTLCTLLKERLPQYHVVPEPLQQWTTESNGSSLLSLFYQDPIRWSYTIETLTMINRVKEQLMQQQSSHEIKIFERSLYSGHYCFALNGKNNGYLNSIEWDIYTKWADFLLSNKNAQPSGFIYLRATPETCHQRINARARSGESTIGLDYLTNIHQLHDDFLLNKKNLPASLISIPVLTLNGEESMLKSKKKSDEYCDQIDTFIKEVEKSQKK
jgi:deoxyadenosine/deoxycytidine kinase